MRSTVLCHISISNLLSFLFYLHFILFFIAKFQSVSANQSVWKWVNLLLNILAGNFREPSPPPPSVVTPPKKTRAKRPLVVNRRQHSRGKKFPAFDTDKFLSKMKKNRAKKPTLPPTSHSPVPSFMLNNNRPYSRSGHYHNWYSVAFFLKHHWFAWRAN